MDLQSLFYIVSIVFILAWLVLLLVIIFAALAGAKSIKRISAKIEEKMDNNAASLMLSLIPAFPLIARELKKWADEKQSTKN